MSKTLHLQAKEHDHLGKTLAYEESIKSLDWMSPETMQL
jgi:predicted metalloendopeptidase